MPASIKSPTGGKDCFKKLRPLQQRHVAWALAHQSPQDAAITMQDYDMCASCASYYAMSALFVFFKADGFTQKHLVNLVAAALTGVYEE